MRLLKAVEIDIPSDKSISHRAIMLAAISESNTCIKNLLMAEDIKRTIEAFRAMGVVIRDIPRLRPSTSSGLRSGKGTSLDFVPRQARDFARDRRDKGVEVIVYGAGMRGLKKPRKPLYLGNSGTTMRLLPGILAGQDFETVLTGDDSLSARPMNRIVRPLEVMGVKVSGIRYQVSGKKDVRPPLKIKGSVRLKAIKYNSKIASAQVKSCILLAGLYASGVTSVSEPEKSRDHTERMLKAFGCRLKITGNNVRLKGPVKLKSPGAINIPGDISSAAFFIVAGCILPKARIIIKNMGLNPTRTGCLDILKKMGADIRIRKVKHKKASETEQAVEPAGDVIVKSSALKGVTISPEEVMGAIDEIPIIMVAACFAKGKTVIKGIEELKIKETDRVKSMITGLSRIGADIKVKGLRNKEEICINGGRPLYGARVSSFGDHRTAMSMLVAGLGAKGKVTVTGLTCIKKSFPCFLTLFKKLPHG